MPFDRIAGRGWLALLGGGEFSFEETEAADGAWLAKAGGRGTVGFLPTASGSQDYGNHFAVYLDEYFERHVDPIPIYRPRDARRGRNAERIAAADHLYVGGGVADHLVATLADTPCLQAMVSKLEEGGTVAAIAAAAQAMGPVVRSLSGGALLDGLGWLPQVAVETNFDPRKDRRLRRLMAYPAVSAGVGIAAGSALLLGPDGEQETIGDVWWLETTDGALQSMS